MSGDHRLGRDGSRLTVLYDRDCGICGLTARALRRWDRARRFELVPVQAAAARGDARLSEVAEHYLLTDELHVVDDLGRVASGGDAALAIVDALPGGRSLRPWAALPPFRALARLSYRLVARYRGALGSWLGLDLVCSAPAVAPPGGNAQEGRPAVSKSSVSEARRSTRKSS